MDVNLREHCTGEGMMLVVQKTFSCYTSQFKRSVRTGYRSKFVARSTPGCHMTGSLCERHLEWMSHDRMCNTAVSGDVASAGRPLDLIFHLSDDANI